MEMYKNNNNQVLSLKLRNRCQTFGWLRSTPFPHMPATALRPGHVRLIVRGQVFDGRPTIYTACYILINVSNIVCFTKYTDKYIAFIAFDLYGRFINRY